MDNLIIPDEIMGIVVYKITVEDVIAVVENNDEYKSKINTMDQLLSLISYTTNTLKN